MNSILIEKLPNTLRYPVAFVYKNQKEKSKIISYFFAPAMKFSISALNMTSASPESNPK